MRTMKGKGNAKAKTKTKTKAKPRSPAKRRQRDRNPRDDRPLSFDSPAQDDMPKQAAASPKHRVHDSIDLVLAECDKVDAALIEITQTDAMPPLTIKEVETAAGGGRAKRGWAVVSADPHKPLTERQAKDVVAAMRSPRTPAPLRIAAE